MYVCLGLDKTQNFLYKIGKFIDTYNSYNQYKCTSMNKSRKNINDHIIKTQY